MAQTCKTAIVPVIRRKESNTPRSTRSERYLERHGSASCRRNCYLGWSAQGCNTALICVITGVNTPPIMPSGDTAEKFLQTAVLCFFLYFISGRKDVHEAFSSGAKITRHHLIYMYVLRVAKHADSTRQ